MHRFALALVILAMCLLPSGPAHAQLGAPDVPSPLTEPPPPPPVEDVDEGLSSLQQILIFAGAALVLATIAFVIVRDAKRAAPDKPSRKSSPAGAGTKPATGAKASGSGAAAVTDTSASAVRARERQRAKRAKAKAKAARQQRKRNRPH